MGVCLLQVKGKTMNMDGKLNLQLSNQQLMPTNTIHLSLIDTIRKIFHCK